MSAAIMIDRGRDRSKMRNGRVLDQRKGYGCKGSEQSIGGAPAGCERILRFPLDYKASDFTYEHDKRQDYRVALRMAAARFLSSTASACRLVALSSAA
jgi:hypothetical protein